MDDARNRKWTHQTIQSYPDNRIAGYTLLDEEPGFTGIYVRDANGGLFPARTVSHEPVEHHRSVCDSWLSCPGTHEDKRTVK